MNIPKTQKVTSVFSSLGITDDLLDILTKRKFINPTPIQNQVIPSALEGKDIIGIAQTGTGKTLAFGIPLIQQLSKRKGGQALILLPTRELALQVNDAIGNIAARFGLRTAVLIGGASMHQQVQQLRRKLDIIVATPGRLADHIKQKNYSLEHVSIIVLDEADRMLDVGFQREITQIMKDTPTTKQSMLFSATMPRAISDLAAAYMKMPLRIEIAPQGTSAQNIEQELFIVDRMKRMQLLDKILSDNDGSILIFSRTKHGAKRIAAAIRGMGHSASEIHSNRSLTQRKMALAGFKSGKYRVLVATDIAARGIDVQNIAIVINFDLPDNSEDYVHRIGRTGRAGASGRAISFAASNERADVKKIESLIRKTLPILKVPTDLPAPRPKIIVKRDQNNFRGGSSNDRNRAPRKTLSKYDKTISRNKQFNYKKRSKK